MEDELGLCTPLWGPPPCVGQRAQGGVSKEAQAKKRHRSQEKTMFKEEEFNSVNCREMCCVKMRIEE